MRCATCALHDARSFSHDIAVHAVGASTEQGHANYQGKKYQGTDQAVFDGGGTLSSLVKTF